jgi:GAF domain-containing protein
MSSNEPDHSVIEEVESIAAGDGPDHERLQRICEALKGRVPHYDWVGFYIAEASEEVLVLGPFAGAPTEHVRIPFGRGICGQAASGRRTFIVQDVSKEDNYLSCGSDVRSEIVLPVMQEGKVIGELDIDSHSISPFTEADRLLLERVCAVCTPMVAQVRDALPDLFKFK